MLSAIVLLVVGAVLAFAGRRFVWLLVGAAGFILGYQIVQLFLPGTDPTVGLIIAVAAGIAGAIVATRSADVVLRIAAFVLLGSAFMTVGDILGLDTTLVQLVLFAVGGVVGLFLLRTVAAQAVMIITALAGATLVALGLPELLNTEPGTLNLIIALAVAVGGYLVQAGVIKESDPAIAEVESGA